MSRTLQSERPNTVSPKDPSELGVIADRVASLADAVDHISSRLGAVHARLTGAPMASEELKGPRVMQPSLLGRLRGDLEHAEGAMAEAQEFLLALERAI